MIEGAPAMAVPTRAELDALVRERLAADSDFRARLLADPRGALSELADSEIPEFISVTIHEESLTDVHLVIPAATGDEIAEDDLELVAGGAVCWFDYCKE
jgi:hypothetical protein